jgi:thioredoxin reductase (NADPH)
MVIPAEAVGLDCSQMPYGIQLADGRQVTGSTVVVASGARYRRPDIPHLHDFEGRGVWYWASPIEARLCRNEEVTVVGGGNSAGQAAVFLRDFAAKVWMLVRGPSLSESMSQYLIDRIAVADNIEVLTKTEITALSGSPEGQLERVWWRNRVTGAETEKPVRNVFIFIGADPVTGWLKDCGVGLDAKGFVRTGAALTAPGIIGESGLRHLLQLEADVANVFAVGDVRAGSVKRVGAAIGEGAAVVAQIHAVLSNASVPAPAVREQSARGRYAPV